MTAKKVPDPPKIEEPQLPANSGPPEGQLDTDGLAAEFGVATAQLNMARRKIMQLQAENEALRKANAQLAKAVDEKQTPAGVPTGAAPRSQRRPIELAERREAAKAAKQKGATGGNATT